MLKPYKVHVNTTITWDELINALRTAAEAVPTGQCSHFDAERLETAARLIRNKLKEDAVSRNRVVTT